MDKKLFANCNGIGNMNKNEKSQYLCYPFEVLRRVHEADLFDNLFCIVKTNLPDKRNINIQKYDMTAADKAYKWHKNDISRQKEFQRKSYVFGDTIWVLKEGSIWYIDMPSPTVNNYCSGRRPILFLNEESIECIVNLKDLEMFQIFKTSQESYCVSVVNESDSHTLNCSTLHCTNWTILICNEDGNDCSYYNKTIHEPTCNESYCTNIALRLDYVFYYYDSKITNVTIKFFVRSIANHIPFMTQLINVKFVMSNISIDQIIKLSGNPGYVHGMPVISSTAKNNHTDDFFNSTHRNGKFLTQVSNKDGLCMPYNGTNNFIKFGINKRLKCRYVYNGPINPKLNSKNACDEIESDIKQLCGITEQIHVSAFGNPAENKANDWLLMNNDIQEKDATYGQFLTKNSKLRCYNLIVRISYVFTFADVSQELTKREDKIIDVKIYVGTQNVTFNLEEFSTVLTIDTNFVDATKPRVYEYAGGPHLNIHLPKDFFFPFHSNGNHLGKLEVPIIMLCFAICQIK